MSSLVPRSELISPNDVHHTFSIVSVRIFFWPPTPQKRWNINFHSTLKTTAFCRHALIHAMFVEFTGYQSPTRPSSRVSFEPTEKSEMKFHCISSNSSGLLACSRRSDSRARRSVESELNCTPGKRMGGGGVEGDEAGGERENGCKHC